MLQTTKTFRVFVSSTFTDMRAERRILQEDVFPRLKVLCESKGASFQDVDLRWGVNEDAQRDQQIMDICLGEIARCQRLSPKPNFIILLGDKYGWQPIPAGITSAEMELIRGELTEKDKAFVDTWYHEDLNACPPVYVLQPRGDEYRLYEDWQKVEKALQAILRNAVSRLSFSEEAKIKYFASATHQEIMRGALMPPVDVMEPREHVFAYLRTIQGLPEDVAAKDYIDLSGEERDAYSKDQLDKLKKDLKRKLPDKHIFPYGATWSVGCTLDNAQAFGNRVYEDLKSVIEEELQDIADVNPLDREKSLHEDFKNQRREHFTGRKDALKAIANYLEGPSRKVFSIIGGSGTGKTSLLAKAIDEANNRKGVKVFRFLGTTSATSDAFRLLADLIDEITSAYDTDKTSLLKEGEEETKFSTLRGLQDIFSRCLSLATAEKPLMIVLDALDQLSRDFKTMPLDWIPKEIPEQVKFIVSALPELKEKLSHTDFYDLGLMPATEGEELLETWLGAIDRTLTTGQMRLVIERFAANGTPLYLKLAFEKARRWHSYNTDITLKPDIDGVLGEYFDGLEGAHGLPLVTKVCGYLLSGKYQGLTENELLDLLVSDDEYWPHFLETCHPDHRQEVKELKRLPIIIWSRLFLDLEPYLTTRNADGLPIISFYHRKFIDYVTLQYLKETLPYHKTLANYFEKAPLYLDEKEARPNIRKVVEQPYQEALSEKWSEIADKSLASFPFLMSKAKADMMEGILEDYVFLWEKAPENTKKQLDMWRAFFSERAHILRRGNPEWPAYKILLQLAIEHADDSPLTIGAEGFLEEGKVDWVWLRRTQRVKNTGINPCIAVLEGHTGMVQYALQLADGRIFSCSYFDMRVWDSDGHFCTALKGHTDNINGAFEHTNGRILSWSDDKTLRIWDADGYPIAVLEGHTDKVNNVIELTDGRILSQSYDKTLRIWDTDGSPIAVLEGHKNFIINTIQLNDGQILSWSYDNTMRIWDTDGSPIAVLEGHTDRIIEVIQFTDGKILSWSDDKTMRLWNADGRHIMLLKGHTDKIDEAFELVHGRILSRSHDKTLRIWDVDGSPIAMLEGHIDHIRGAIQLTDGQILSWSDDKTLRIWDANGSPIAVLEGHTDHVNGAIQLTDGRLLSWSDDKTLRIWGINGQSSALLEGHTNYVYGAFQLSDGRILSQSHLEMRVWDIDGHPLTFLDGHIASVNGAIQLTDGRILSWSNDKTLRIWDTNKYPITILKKHTDYVYGTHQLTDGRILSWSDDTTLRIWDANGVPIAVLEGHTDNVNGAIQLTDGHILSWSDDKALCIWDTSARLITMIEGHSSVGNLIAWFDKLHIWNVDGKDLSVLERHLRTTNGALQLTDGRILSWTNDTTLRIWDTYGHPISLLEGHKDWIINAIQLNDGHILSWSYDNTLGIWDTYGRPLIFLEGHANNIFGARQLSDGRILSWSDYENLYIWNNITGACIEALNFTEFCIRYPQSIPHCLGKDLYYSGFFSFAGWRWGEIKFPIRGKNIILCARWQADYDCTPHSLISDGTMVLTQANGQVCFLKLYYGTTRICLDKLLLHLGFSPQPYDPQSLGQENLKSAQEIKNDYEQILREGLKYHQDHYGSNIECHHGHLCALVSFLEKEGRFNEAAELESERDEVAIQLPVKEINAITLREQSLDFFNKGAYTKAEENLRKMLEAKFEVPGTRCHLARVLIMQGKIDGARKEIQLAWEHHNEASAYVGPRIIWFQIALDVMDGAGPALHLGRLKTALSADGAHMEWTMTPVLEKLRQSLLQDNHAFLTALVAALSARENLPALDQFPAWRDAEPQPLD